MDALEMAMKMETDAISFYTEASQKTRYPVGKKMFLTICQPLRATQPGFRRLY